MKLNPHFSFDGNCAAALEFYEKRFGAHKLFAINYANTPMTNSFPADFKDKIMHATIKIGDVVVMCSDSPPGTYVKPTGFHVSLSVENPTDAERLFGALSENGKVEMPLQKTFWALKFGVVTDQFGIPWMVNCADPNVTS